MRRRKGRIIEEVLDKRAIRRLAGPGSLERGETYFAGGRVRSLVLDDGTITAKVRGRQEYRVRLWAKGTSVAYSCTCPLGSGGAFCKHCVATGLAWLARPAEVHIASRGARAPAVTMGDVRAYLAAQDKDALVKMLMDQVREDNRLRERLLIQVARKGSKGLNLATFRAAIDNAVDAGGFVDYRSAYQYAEGIDQAVDTIKGLLKDGHAAEVIELAEYAIAAVEDATDQVDDSGGHMGEILHRLQDLHHAACKKARPDPEVLAKRLFEWELRSDMDTFLDAAERYKAILGKKGLAEYRRLAEAEWARLPALPPGQHTGEGAHRPWQITHIMETMARQRGDVEALVRIKCQDLSHAYSFLQIAEIYKKARRRDLALEWAERGVKAFPERTDSRLRDFLAEEYHRRNRHEEAMALIWPQLTDVPGFELYKKLKSHADRVGQWAGWREKALALLRDHVARAKTAARPSVWRWSPAVDHSLLVEVFLWEKDVDAAWREAKDSGCSGALWLELATRLENDRPQDALGIYQAQIAPTVDQKGEVAYREAVRLLRKVHALMGRIGQGSEFAAYLESIRAAHKPKRNFIKLLDATKWT